MTGTQRALITMLVACALAGGIQTGKIAAAQTENEEVQRPASKALGDAYLLALEYAIWSHWFPPQSLKDHQIASVTFTLSPAGQLEDIRLEKSTGNIAVNKAAMWAVESAKKKYAARNNPPPEGAARFRFRFARDPLITGRNRSKLNLLERLPEPVKREN